MTKITRIIRTLGIGALAMGMLLASPLVMQASAPFVTPVMPVSQPAPVQHRFTHSYDFETGMSYRNDLGRSTAFHGNVPQNVFTHANKKPVYKPLSSICIIQHMAKFVK